MKHARCDAAGKEQCFQFWENGIRHRSMRKVQSASSKQYCQASSPNSAPPFDFDFYMSKLEAGEVGRMMLYFARFLVHLSRLRKDQAKRLSLLL